MVISEERLKKELEETLKQLKARLPRDPSFKLNEADPKSTVYPISEFAFIKTIGEKQPNSYFISGIHEEGEQVYLICSRGRDLEEIKICPEGVDPEKVKGVPYLRSPSLMDLKVIKDYWRQGKTFAAALHAPKKEIVGPKNLEEEIETV